MICTKVCKTFIHRFDSDPRLQSKSHTKQTVRGSYPINSDNCESPLRHAENGEAIAKRLTASLTRNLTAGACA